MNTEFQCKTVFTSAKGKRYSHGDVIGQSEFDTLYHNERNNFNDITPVEYHSGESPIKLPIGAIVGGVQIDL